ncbi:MAG: cobalamin B12-binding domain-containing protein [Tissierella sp.]|uniref:cobalamin B12-binding domain-containing protein n=1 Tax=Tissierella sp. TaxID=41274 RepID=UPI003F9555CB
MEELYKKLLLALKKHDKEIAVKTAIDALENKKVDVLTLYEDILGPALNNVTKEFKDEDRLIWQEHVRSEIIITIIENSYLYVLKEKEERAIKREERVVVLCPKFEDHAIGAKMAADIFTIAGYETTFIGANTPWKTIIKSIENKRPHIISIGVTNFYNLLETKKTIDRIKEEFDYKIKFALGGHALKKSKELYKQIGGDIYLERLKDIFSLKEEVKQK